MKQTKKASTSQEVESSEKKRETAKPLADLCQVYKYDYDKALDASFDSRLKLFRVDGTVFCKTRNFRAFLEEEWDAGRYKEMATCTDCKEERPLFYFAYSRHEHRSTTLGNACRECMRKYSKKEKVKKETYGGLFDEEENATPDCRLYKSADDFIGKQLLIETKHDGSIIAFLSMTITNVVPEMDGRSFVFMGKDKSNNDCYQKVFICEYYSLCYEGTSTFWSEKAERLYKKVIISNN